MELIELFLDTENELRFKVKVEGTRAGSSRCRLVVENSEVNLMMDGRFISSDEVEVIIPPFANILKEGTYRTSLEVMVDDRIFIPLTLDAKFEKSVSVTAEAVSRTRRSRPKATASLITSGRSARSHQIQNKHAEPQSRQPEIKENKNVVTDRQIRDLIKAAAKSKGRK